MIIFAGVTGSQVRAFNVADNWADRATMPVPDGAKVTLQTDRDTYFLGENVLVHFALENTSDQPFKASFGGDYRGSTRSLRFIVTATDEAGQVAEDPDTRQMNMGGMMGDREIKPGTNYTENLLLMRYCRIVKPGRYAIRVAHDFGWKEDDQRKRPIGEITLTFRMPTPDEAEEVVSAMADNPKSAEFWNLTYPVYLKPLLQRAEKGDVRALQGISCMATREATEALINLSTNAHSKVTQDAIDLLMMRLPKPENVKPPSFWENYWGTPPFTKEFRQHLVEQSWDASYVPAVRALATSLLAQTDSGAAPANDNFSASGSFSVVQTYGDAVTTGAIILQSIGTPDDAEVILKTLDRAFGYGPKIKGLDLIKPRNNPKDNILDLPRSLQELVNTMNVLRDRGFVLTNRGGKTWFFLHFTWLADGSIPRPKDWLRTLTTFGGDQSWYPGRIAALNSIPKPLPDECVAFVMERLSDKDLGVCRVACGIAGESGNKIFLNPLLEIIAIEHHEWLLREAIESAKKLNAGFELLETLADRLTEEHFYNDILRSLSSMIFEGNSLMDSGRTDFSRSQRLALRNAWKNFLTAHADELRQGKKFKSSDPAITPALFGRTQALLQP
jgi:hypothetical protein